MRNIKNILIFIIFCLIFNSVNAAIEDYNDNLTEVFTFNDETIGWTEGAVGGHNFTVSGNLTYVDSNLGKAYSFNGGYLNYDSAVLFNNPQGQSSFTVGLWIKPITVIGAEMVILESYRENFKDQSRYRLVIENDGDLVFWYDGYNGASRKRVRGGIQFNEWNFVSFGIKPGTEAGGGYAYLGINGARTAWTLYQPTILDIFYRGYVGNSMLSAQNFQGEIDEIYFWDTHEVIHSANSELLDIYLNHNTTPFFFPCVGNWSCNSYTCNSTSGVNNCVGAIDLNACGDAYTGDYSELVGTCVIVEEEDYDEGSTVLDDIEDFENVTDFTLVSSGSAVQWKETINISGANLTSTIIITTGMVSIDSTTLDESLNSVADVVIDTADVTKASCGSFELYYIDEYFVSASNIINHGQLVATQSDIGKDCRDGSICKNVACVNGAVNFEAQHFDGYAIQSNQEARRACQSTKALVFVGLGLIALAIIIIAAFAIVKISDGDISIALLTGITITVIGLAIVVMVGYIILGSVGNIIC